MTNSSLAPDVAPGGEQVRPWAIAPLFIAQALVMGATTVGTILASMIMGHMNLPSLVGLPVTLISVAGAFSAGYFGTLMMQKGRRFGLGISFVLGGVGSIIGFFGGQSKSLVVFLIGAVLVGIAQGGYFQARYALIESVPESKRGSLLGMFMLAGVVGSFAISGFSGPIGSMSKAMGTTFEVGGWLIGGVMLLFSAGLLMLWKPTKPPSSSSSDTEKLPLAEAIKIPGVRTTALAIALSQAVMLALMALLPIQAEALHVHEKNIALMISGHILGMYGLAWLTGPLIDRLGTPFAYAIGTVLLVVSAITAPIPGAFWVAFSFFVLGLGWNFVYMAGSKAMARFPSAQGVSDGLGYLLSAIFTFGGGLLISATNFATMSFVAGLLSLPIFYSAWRAKIHEQETDPMQIPEPVPAPVSIPTPAPQFQPQPQMAAAAATPVPLAPQSSPPVSQPPMPQQPVPVPAVQSQPPVAATQMPVAVAQDTQTQVPVQAMAAAQQMPQAQPSGMRLAAAPVISAGEGQSQYNKPVITKFAVEPVQVSGNEPVVIRWATHNAEKVAIAGIGDVPFSGTCTIQPIDNMEVNLTAYSGTLTTSRVQHLVILPPQIRTFEVTQFGAEMILTWDVQHAAMVEIQGLGRVNSQGQHRWQAQDNTHFTLTASSVNGKVVTRTTEEAFMAAQSVEATNQPAALHPENYHISDHHSPSANLVDGLSRGNRNVMPSAQPEIDPLYAATQPNIESFTVHRSGTTGAVLAWRVSNIDRIRIDGIEGPNDDGTWPPQGRIRVKVKSGKIFTLRAGSVVQARSLVMPSAGTTGTAPARMANGASRSQYHSHSQSVNELHRGSVLPIKSITPIGDNQSLAYADFAGTSQHPKGILYISEIDGNHARGRFTSESAGMDQVPVDIVFHGNSMTISLVSTATASAKSF